MICCFPQAIVPVSFVGGGEGILRCAVSIRVLRGFEMVLCTAANGDALVMYNILHYHVSASSGLATRVR